MADLPLTMAELSRAHVAILLHEDNSLSLALLVRDILLRANRQLGRACLDVAFVARSGLSRVVAGPVTVRASSAARAIDHLVVPPLTSGGDPFVSRPAESRLIDRVHDRGAVIHAACLGSLVVAQAGVLDGRVATTHWAWVQQARRRYPDVEWDAARMICDTGDVVTAGGFLAAVDLTLALVERMGGRSVARDVGRLLLVDSVRQHQSVFATSLVSRVDEPRMRKLHRWIDAHLSAPIAVDDMARACNLSARTFHRVFTQAHGVTPKKLVQLKRIERVRAILRDPDVSIEEAIQRVGVSDVPSFRKIFRRELGLSPAEYRRRLRG